LALGKEQMGKILKARESAFSTISFTGAQKAVIILQEYQYCNVSRPRWMVLIVFNIVTVYKL